MTRPTQEVVDAIESGRTTVIRRADLYEADGDTPWYPEGSIDDAKPRLSDGSISIDYSRDERRGFDITLDNRDKLLRPNSEGGLWYDKVIKMYRGVRYETDSNAPTVVIAEAPTDPDAIYIKQMLNSLGFTRVTINRSAAVLSDVFDYGLVVSYMPSTATAKASLLAAAYSAGMRVLTFGNGNDETTIPFITVTSAGSPVWGIDPVPYDTPLAGGWSAEDYAAEAGERVTTVRATAIVVSSILDGATQHHTAIIEENNDTGGRWFHYHPQTIGTEGKKLLANGLAWLWNYSAFRNWEQQVGEFTIDRIDSDYFPSLVKVNGRDYTKKCLTSKIEQAMTFPPETSLDQLVQALAANAGITKFNLPATGLTLGETMSFERGTERWNVIKQAAAPANMEVFFDASGYLTMREYQDPSLGDVSHVFKTGEQGNLVTFSRSLNDSRIYNHIVVTGESNEEGVLPFFAEAKNEDPFSPTRIGRIGDRSYFFTSSFFTDVSQCQTYANSLLKLHALESYEINWESFVYPWLEGGDVIQLLDPDANTTDPNRFLMDTLTIPMSLGPMQATGKRVTFVPGTV